MARKWVPLSPSKDLDPRLVRLFKQINLYMGDQSGSIAAISRGEAPDGSGTPLPVVGLDKYFFLPGRNGGQIGFGGQGSGESLTLASTASATKGSIFLGTTGVFDEVNTRFGLNKLVPTATIHVKQFSTGGNLNFFPVDPSNGSWGVVGPSAAQALADNNDATYIQSGWDTFYAEVVDLPTITNLGLIPDNAFSVTIRVKLLLAVGNYLNPMTVRVYHGSGGSGNIIASRDLAASLFSDSSFTDYTFTLTPSEGADFKTSGIHSFRFSNVGQTIPNADFNVYRAYLTAPGGASAGSPFVYESSAGINQAFIDYLGSLTANGLTVRDATTIAKAVTFDLTSAFSGTQILKFLSTAARTWTFPDVTATLAYISPLLDGINNSDTLAGNVLLGDLIHGNATPKWARLAGNTTTTKKWLSQTGTGAASAVPAWDTLAFADLPGTRIEMEWIANGPYTVDTSVDGGFVAPSAMTIKAVWLYRTTAGASTSTILDLNKNGTTMYTTQANRPTIAFNDGDNKVQATLPDVTSIAAGDIISVDTDQIEGGTPANWRLVVEAA
jgi:hypothetical protein